MPQNASGLLNRMRCCRVIRGRCGSLLAVLALLPTSSLCQATRPRPPAVLKTLETAREVHRLSLQEGARGYPVHLRAVVTYFDPFIDARHTALFVHDQTGSIFVSVPQGAMGPAPAGTIVDVRGVSGLGDFAPIVAQPAITVVGKTSLPRAHRVTLPHLLSGVEDGQWVEVEGIVRSVFLTDHDVTLQVAMLDGVIGATALREKGFDYNSLMDAKVRIQANEAPLFNGDRQMTGVRLLSPNLSAMQVLEAAPPNPYALPVRPIEDLARYVPMANLPHRVHIQGRVTLQWPGSLLCIQDATRGLCADVKETTPVAQGTLVDVVGFVAKRDSGPTLTNASFQFASKSTPLPVAPLAAKERLRLSNDAQVVQIEGELVGRDYSSSETVLVLAKGDFLFTAVLPEGLRREAERWSNGSRLRVTGICSVAVDVERTDYSEGTAVPKSFRVLLRSPEDVAVVSRPPWWSAGRALMVLGGVLFLTLSVFGWVMVLRRRVRAQTEVIRQSEERFRYLAQHDALTGLPTRMLLNERLEAAIQHSRGGEELALMMLDLDNFKGINDVYGHHAGDETLCVTARRIVETVRKSDTVARLGGDEFIVLLQGISNANEAEAIAAKVVSALSKSIHIDGHEVAISASVGLCKVTGGVLDSHAILRSVDHAMYRAKARGKNCFDMVTPEMTCA